LFCSKIYITEYAFIVLNPVPRLNDSSVFGIWRLVDLLLLCSSYMCRIPPVNGSSIVIIALNMSRLLFMKPDIINILKIFQHSKFPTL
jgi:hypothetical protein